MKVFTIYGHGGNLGRVTLTIYIYMYFVSAFLRRLHIKFGLDWPRDLEKKIFENGGHIHVYSPRAGADNPLGSNIFINTFSQSIESFAACFSLINDFVTFFHIQMYR